jgi:hypothetical protein
MLQHYRDIFWVAPWRTTVGLVCFIPVFSLCLAVAATLLFGTAARFFPHTIVVEILAWIADLAWWMLALLPGSSVSKIFGAGVVAVLGLRLLLSADHELDRRLKEEG